MDTVLIEGGSGIRVLLDRLDPPAAVKAAVEAFETGKQKVEKVPAKGYEVVRKLRAYQAGDVLCDALLAHMFAKVIEAMEEEGETPDAPPEPTIVEKAKAEGYTIEEGGGGWFTVTGPAMPEPQKAQGEKKLDALLTELMDRDLGD